MRRLAFGNFLVGVVSILLMTSQVRPCSAVAGMPACEIPDVMHLLLRATLGGRLRISLCMQLLAMCRQEQAVEPSCWHADCRCHKAGCITEDCSKIHDWLELARA